MTIGDFLHQQTASLTATGITTARLDVLVLLEDSLKKDKSWLLAHLEAPLSSLQLRNLRKQCAQRIKRTPLAYIRNKQEFYGRNFAVTPDVLIPRPETEAIIETIKEYSLTSMLDIGTGSGCVAITAALELPNCAVAASDISQHALHVATKNARSLGANVSFIKSDLLKQVIGRFDIITANLPYVDNTWERSPETKAEPTLALFAADGGLALIKKMIAEAPQHLNADGLLVLEADPRQHAAIINFAAAHFAHTVTDGFILTLRLK